jgi:hypothetical protein
VPPRTPGRFSEHVPARTQNISAPQALLRNVQVMSLSAEGAWQSLTERCLKIICSDLFLAGRLTHYLHRGQESHSTSAININRKRHFARNYIPRSCLGAAFQVLVRRKNRRLSKSPRLVRSSNNNDLKVNYPGVVRVLGSTADETVNPSHRGGAPMRFLLTCLGNSGRRHAPAGLSANSSVAKESMR